MEVLTRWRFRKAIAPALLSYALLSAAVAGPSNSRLYDALGGSVGLSALVHVFVGHLYDDKHIGPFFADVDRAAAYEKLRLQFCELAGGPCKTANPDMKKAHAAMDVTRGDFFAVLALLRQSMDERGIPPDVQQRLLDKLQPMQDDIVNTP